MTLISKRGNLLEAYRELQRLHPGIQICQIDELMRERRLDPALRDQQIYAADGLVYLLEKGRSTLAITTAADNPILRHPDEASEQFLQRGIYRPRSQEVKDIIENKDREEAMEFLNEIR